MMEQACQLTVLVGIVWVLTLPAGAGAMGRYGTCIDTACLTTAECRSEADTQGCPRVDGVYPIFCSAGVCKGAVGYKCGGGFDCATGYCSRGLERGNGGRGTCAVAPPSASDPDMFMEIQGMLKQVCTRQRDCEFPPTGKYFGNIAGLICSKNPDLPNTNECRGGPTKNIYRIAQPRHQTCPQTRNGGTHRETGDLQHGIQLRRTC